MSFLLVGGGIAGASLAYFLSRLGHGVTVLDAGLDTASQVPSALLNPVRGQSGQVDAQMIAGMRFTWQLVTDLQAQGFGIRHQRAGLWRPLPNDKTQAKFCRNLPADLPHSWHSAEALSGTLSGDWPHLLFIPEGGWLVGAELVQALLAAAQQRGAKLLRGRALSWTSNTMQTEQEQLKGAAVVFCGGSLGASWRNQASRSRGHSSLEQTAEVHRAGTLLYLDHVPAQTLSFGAYLTPTTSIPTKPAVAGQDLPIPRLAGVLGATFEAPSSQHAAGPLPLESYSWLLAKGAALVPLEGRSVTGSWTGVRLANLRAGQAAGGHWELTGLGSKGFLLGPLLASQLAAKLSLWLSHDKS